jgi:hypothetical protein
MNDEDELEATTYCHYLWDCPLCGEVNDEGDIEPQGLTECGDCGSSVYIS